VIFLYYGQFEHYGYCENWIADALDRNGHHCLRIRRTTWFDESRLLKIASDNHATHLLLSKCPEIKPEQLQIIKDAGLKIVFWTFDWMREPEAWQWYRPLAKIADICFQTDGYGDNENYVKAGIHRVELHQGFVPVLHDIPKSGVSTRHLDSDVVFIGSEYTQRRHDLVETLRSIDGEDFQKWGEPHDQIWGADFADAVYFSKIAVGDNFVNDVPGYWSDRVYLTLACGGFFLTAYVPGLEKEFRCHQNLVWYHDFDELQDLIRFYSPRESLRRRIALNGYRKVHSRDSYDDRIRQFTRELENM
jgi:Glycosyl transferases group 1